MRRPTTLCLPMLLITLPISAQSVKDFLHFKLTLPSGLTLIDKSPAMMDFNLYEIQDQHSKVVARLYAGNHPSTQLIPSSTRRITDKLSVKFAESPAGSKQYELLLEFEGLSYKSQAFSLWTCLHLFDVSADPSVRSSLVSAFKNISISHANLD